MTCDPVTGSCQCLPGVTGPNCNECLSRWVMIEGIGCQGKIRRFVVLCFGIFIAFLLPLLIVISVVITIAMIYTDYVDICEKLLSHRGCSNIHIGLSWSVDVDWFGEVVMALVTSTKLNYIEHG